MWFQEKSSLSPHGIFKEAVVIEQLNFLKFIQKFISSSSFTSLHFLLFTFNKCFEITKDCFCIDIETIVKIDERVKLFSKWEG